MGYGTPLDVCPMAFWVMLQSIMGYGHTPPRCEQTENITFPILRIRAVTKLNQLGIRGHGFHPHWRQLFC